MMRSPSDETPKTATTHRFALRRLFWNGFRGSRNVSPMRFRNPMWRRSPSSFSNSEWTSFTVSTPGSFNGGPGTGHLRCGGGLENQERVHLTFRVSRKLQSQHGYGVWQTGSSFFQHKPAPALTTCKDHRSLIGVHNSHHGCGIGSNTSRELFTELTFSRRNEGLLSTDAFQKPGNRA